jgi:hypothetical protein
MRKRYRGPAGPGPTKRWIAEPFQRGHLYYDPATNPGPLRIARLWFSAKHPNISCLLAGLFFLGIIAGYIWLTIVVFIQSGGDMNRWMVLGLTLVFWPFVALFALWLYKIARKVFSKPSLPLGPPEQKKSKRRKRSSKEEQPPRLFDPADPAGFAQWLPTWRIHDMPKLRAPRSRKKKEKTEEAGG